MMLVTATSRVESTTFYVARVTSPVELQKSLRKVYGGLAVAQAADGGSLHTVAVAQRRGKCQYN